MGGALRYPLPLWERVASEAGGVGGQCSTGVPTPHPPSLRYRSTRAPSLTRGEGSEFAFPMCKRKTNAAETMSPPHRAVQPYSVIERSTEWMIVQFVTRACSTNLLV